MFYVLSNLSVIQSPCGCLILNELGYCAGRTAEDVDRFLWSFDGPEEEELTLRWKD